MLPCSLVQFDQSVAHSVNHSFIAPLLTCSVLSISYPFSQSFIASLLSALTGYFDHSRREEQRESHSVFHCFSIQSFVDSVFHCFSIQSFIALCFHLLFVRSCSSLIPFPKRGHDKHPSPEHTNTTGNFSHTCPPTSPTP